MPSHMPTSAILRVVPATHACWTPTPCSQVLHYSIGGQFARVVRLQDKWATSTPAAFLLGFVLSSSMPWQVR